MVKGFAIAITVALFVSLVGLSCVAAERTRPPVFPEDGTPGAAIQRELPIGTDIDADVLAGPVLTR